MGSSTPLAWLAAHKTQRDVLDGLAKWNDWETLWSECPRGDWLLGIAERIGVDHTLLVRAAIACARIADVPATPFLDLCERWLAGDTTAEAIAEATKTLDAFSAADPAVEASTRAALAVGMGIADRGVLSSAPSAAVESVMMASIDCGFELAMRWAHDTCATAVRSVLTWDVIAPCVERLEERG